MTIQRVSDMTPFRMGFTAKDASEWSQPNPFTAEDAEIAEKSKEVMNIICISPGFLPYGPGRQKSPGF